MKGIIMAGGEGSRLRPLTCDLPKPMVPIMDRPVMTYCIELLLQHGITDIGVTLQYLPDVIKSYFGNGSEYGVNLNYFIEETPLGTAGSVKNAQSFLDETFIVISGDALTDIDLKKAVDFHKKNKSMATLVLKRIDVPLEYGVVVTDENGSITRFLEKPNWGEVFSDTVNTGIYILEPEVLDYFEPGIKYDFSQQLFPALLKDGQPMYGYITDGYWCDIGNSKSYLTAHYDMLGRKVKFPIPGEEIKEGVWAGKDAVIDKGAVLEPPCYIGDYVRIESGAQIGSYTVIGAHSVIESEASIKRSVLWKHVHMGKKTEVRGAALCRKVVVKDRSAIFEGVVVGDDCRLNNDTVVKPEVKIWPDKTIDEGVVVHSNIIWGTGHKRSLFGKDGIFGSINCELDPQTVTRIASAYGAYLKPGKRAAISTDHRKCSNMLKYGIISGLLSSGVEVFDLGQLTTPMLRYAVLHLALDGGIHIMADSSDPYTGRLHFIDNHGCNLPPSAERKIENLYIRDDSQRELADNIKKVHTMQDIPVFYIRHLIESLDTGAISGRQPRVLIKSNGRIGSYVLNIVLKESGCIVDKYTGDDISDAVTAGGYDLGCIMDANCETFDLFDEKGVKIDKSREKAVIGIIYLKEKQGSKLVVPYTESRAMESLADSYKCSVVRTKSSRSALMKEVLEVDNADSDRISKLFPLYFDGTAALAKIIELISTEKRKLSEIVKSVPRLHMKHKSIKCPWSEKGRVMRMLIEEERNGDKSIELYEGIRINYDNGWALILPDSDEPVCRIYSEGFSEEFAEELAALYEKKINRIIG